MTNWCLSPLGILPYCLRMTMSLIEILPTRMWHSKLTSKLNMFKPLFFASLSVQAICKASERVPKAFFQKIKSEITHQTGAMILLCLKNIYFRVCINKQNNTFLDNKSKLDALILEWHVCVYITGSSICWWRWRGGSVGRASASIKIQRTKVRIASGAQEQFVIVYPSQKWCADLLSVCPTPACIRTHKNDHVRTLKTL